MDMSKYTKHPYDLWTSLDEFSNRHCKVVGWPNPGHPWLVNPKGVAGVDAPQFFQNSKIKYHQFPSNSIILYELPSGNLTVCY